MGNNQWDIIKARYIASAVRPDQYPLPALEEVAFVGRSNVGKSSLINSLTRYGKLARVSGSPGKTQTINFYELESKKTADQEEIRAKFFLVDLPGYGFAKTAKTDRERWSAFIHTYLTASAHLRMVCQLIDIRHKPLEIDIECYKWLNSCGLFTQVILTKSDKVSKNIAASQTALFKRTLGIDDSRILAYSSTQHTMRYELINRVMAAVEVR